MPEPISTFGACRLTDRGVIHASGPDAASFLQSQLTNDLLGLGTDAARLAGFCSAKGRLQATFIVWRGEGDDFFLVCPTDLLAPTLKRLAMFVLRAKCKLRDASAEIELLGVAGPTALEVLAGASLWAKRMEQTSAVIRLPDGAGVPRALIAAPKAGVGRVAAPRALDLSLDLDAWHWLDVRSGIVTIEAATVDRFVPQMVNFELVGGVDFQKGCYPGQEVVARSHYRGTTKRRTFAFDCDALAAPGQDVHAASAGANPGANEAVGTVANSAPHPFQAGSSALAEVRLASLDNDLRLGSPNGPRLHRIELPYAVAVETEAAG